MLLFVHVYCIDLIAAIKKYIGDNYTKLHFLNYFKSCRLNSMLKAVVHNHIAGFLLA